MKHWAYRVAGVAALFVLLALAVYEDRQDLPTQILMRYVNAPTPTLAPTPTPLPSQCTTVRLPTSDALELAATYCPPLVERARSPGLLLLHMAYSDRASWRDFALEAQRAGYAVLVPDLRGHGESQGEKAFDPVMDRDFEAAYLWLVDRPEVDGNRVLVAGASLGASLALRGGARYPAIRSVLMLSPAIQLWDIGLVPAITDYGERPLLLVVAEGDTYPAASCQQLNAMALGLHELLIYPGAAHGTALLAEHEGLSQVLLDWMAAILEP